MQGKSLYNSLHVHYKALLFVHINFVQNGGYRGHIQQRIKNLLEAACGLAYLHSTEGGLPVVTHGDIKS